MATQNATDSQKFYDHVNLYDGYTLDDNAAIGDVVSSGYCQVEVTGGAGFDRAQSPPGVIRFQASDTIYAFPFPNTARTLASGWNVGRLAIGFKTYFKGQINVLTDTRFNAALEKFAFAFVATSGTISTTTDAATNILAIGNQTETTRDDMDCVAVVIDSSNNIQSYNCATTGNAAYTDSTFNASMAAPINFELIIEVPSTATTFANCLVTVKVEDDGGTMRTILNATNPVGVTSITTTTPTAVILGNVTAKVTGHIYRVEVAA